MEILTVESFKEKVFNFEQSKTWNFQGPRPAIIDFYADWCGPCRMLAPILEEVEKSYSGKVDVYKVNTEATPELAALFGVRGIPSLLFVPMIGEPAMSSGVIQEDGFEKAILELFNISKSG
jgi:thioredoxin 1